MQHDLKQPDRITTRYFSKRLRAPFGALAASLILLGGLTGCGRMHRGSITTAKTPAPLMRYTTTSARLACFQDTPSQQPPAPLMGPPAPKLRDRAPKSRTRPTPTAGATTPVEREAPLGPIAPSDPSATQALPYTMPGLAYRQMAIFVVTAAIGTASDLRGAGEEVSQSLVFSPEGTAGKLGRTTAPTVLRGQVVSRFNRQQGAATGFTFASRNNLFTARSNPASGAHGRCRELIGAGFFRGDHARCGQTVRKRR